MDLKGNRAHMDCKGGQFCWEDEVVLYVNGKKYDNFLYGGYGEVYRKEDNESYSFKDGTMTYQFNDVTFDPFTGDFPQNDTDIVIIGDHKIIFSLHVIHIIYIKSHIILFT